MAPFLAAPYSMMATMRTMAANVVGSSRRFQCPSSSASQHLLCGADCAPGKQPKGKSERNQGITSRTHRNPQMRAPSPGCAHWRAETRASPAPS